ncbi:hypothetical protein [Yoonia sp. BS5-3]|uniref:Uncharacterized protein n=1 Tax=Yoonia phaeophyticola TaxID=3137369 RepID=A0ABZ2V4Q5_9RHOB
MNAPQMKRGGAPVGHVAELDGIEAASVIYLRLWCDGPDGQDSVSEDFAMGLGPENGAKARDAFAELCRLCAHHGRRPMMRHGVSCKCLGADEACFANFIGAAAQGASEDAMLIATLMVRADFAPLVTALAADVGQAFRMMNLRAPECMAGKDAPFYPPSTTLH